jgi:hypothetical protein
MTQQQCLGLQRIRDSIRSRRLCFNTLGSLWQGLVRPARTVVVFDGPESASSRRQTAPKYKQRAHAKAAKERARNDPLAPPMTKTRSGPNR